MVMSKLNFTGAELLVKAFTKYGVRKAFGLLGGANLPVGDALYKSDIKFVAGIHEQTIGHVAEGYAKVTRKPSVLLVTSGPGATNCITPAYDAYVDGIPMVILSGQVPVPSIGTDAFQEAPSVGLFSHCTKWSGIIETVDDIPAKIKNAFEIASSGRPGPVHLALPKDVMSTMTSDVEICDLEPNKEPHPKSEDVDKLLSMIKKSKRPVIIAGHGCIGSSEQLRKFAIDNNIPVTTTLHGLGVFDECHQLSLKFHGMHGHPVANFAVHNADLIIAIGSRFDDRTTGGYNNYAPFASKNGGIVHIDICDKQIEKVKKLVSIGLSIRSGCENMLNCISDQLPLPDTSNWLNQIYEWRKEFSQYNIFENYSFDSDLIKTQCVIKEIDRQMKQREMYDVIFTHGVGNHLMMSAQFIDWRTPGCFQSSGSAGTMGVGVPFAIGAKHANPSSKVICIDGDGSFNMTYMELASAARDKIPIVIFIMNDRRQQMVHVWQNLFFEKRYIGTDNHNPDYKYIADAFGIDYISCKTKMQLEKAVGYALDHNDGPLIVDASVVPDICFPLVAPGKPLNKMLLENGQTDQIDISGLPPS